MSKWNEVIQQMPKLNFERKSWDEEPAAARLAGKIEGMERAALIVLTSSVGTDIVRELLSRALRAEAEATRAKITELEATAAATPRLSEEPSA